MLIFVDKCKDGKPMEKNSCTTLRGDFRIYPKLGVSPEISNFFVFFFAQIISICKYVLVLCNALVYLSKANKLKMLRPPEETIFWQFKNLQISFNFNAKETQLVRKV